MTNLFLPWSSQSTLPIPTVPLHFQCHGYGVELSRTEWVKCCCCCCLFFRQQVQGSHFGPALRDVHTLWTLIPVRYVFRDLFTNIPYITVCLSQFNSVNPLLSSPLSNKPPPSTTPPPPCQGKKVDKPPPPSLLSPRPRPPLFILH